MEHVKIVLGNPAEYDKAVHCETPDMGDLSVITKDHAMTSGRAAAVLTFTAVVKGKKRQVQTVVSMRNMKMIAAALAGRYDDDGALLPHHASDGSENERGQKH